MTDENNKKVDGIITFKTFADFWKVYHKIINDISNLRDEDIYLNESE